MKYDATLKELLQAPPQKLLHLLTGQEASELLTVEYPTVQMRRPDLVVRLADGSLFHLELQSGNDAEMPRRMLEYYVLLWRQYGQRPRQRLLYVGAGRMNMTASLDYEELRFHYELTDIRTLHSATLLASPSVEDNVLAVLCEGGIEPDVIRQIIQRIAPLPEKARADALVKLLILAGLRNAQGEVTEEARQTAMTIDIRQNSFLNEVFQEGRNEGRNEGRTEGLLVGIESLLELKFGHAGLAVADQLRASNPDWDKLLQLKNAIPKANTVADLQLK